MTPYAADRIIEALSQFGSKAYNTPSGAILDLMTELTEEDDLACFSRAYVILTRAKPSNAGFVANAVPAKISNFIIRHRGINISEFLQWAQKNPEWDDNLKNAVRNPERFPQVVAVMVEQIKLFGRQTHKTRNSLTQKAKRGVA